MVTGDRTKEMSVPVLDDLHIGGIKQDSLAHKFIMNNNIDTPLESKIFFYCSMCGFFLISLSFPFRDKNTRITPFHDFLLNLLVRLIMAFDSQTPYICHFFQC